MTSVFRIPFALLAFLGFVMVLPPWMWFVGTYAPELDPASAFLARLVLPASVSILGASWLQPR
jgi:hypothetical protein